MLASTMQFSKYGQEHQPDPPLPTDNAHTGENTPHPDTTTRSLVKAGPSHTTTPTTIHKDYQPVQQVTQKNQNNP
jgi:hypothetical protein